MSYRVPRKDDMIIHDNSEFEIITDNETGSSEGVAIDSPDPGLSKTEWAEHIQTPADAIETHTKSSTL